MKNKLKLMLNKNFWQIILAVFFLFQPMVVYLSAFEPGDCDDKAVHYYTASYWMAKTERKKQFDELVHEFSAQFKGDEKWKTTQTRMSIAAHYPLANSLIGIFTKQGQPFPLNVNNGLFLVTFFALVLFVLIACLTPFGFWQALLLANLVAFYSLKVRFLVPEVPANMLPFISYVPRGGLALLAVAPLLSYAAKKKKLFLISLALMLCWHLGMAVMFIGFIILTLLIKKLLVKITYKRKKDYYYNLFILTAILLFLQRIASILIGFLVNRNISYFWFIQSPFLVEVPSRLSGFAYVNLILLIICGMRILLRQGKGKFFELKFKGKPVQLKPQMIIWMILIFLTMNHLSSYSWVMQKKTGFFLPQCQGYEVVQLPKEAKKLNLIDVPSFFLSLAQFLQ